MSSISYVNVYYFFIIIPLALLFAVPFFLAVRRDNCNGHNVASFAIHLLLAVLVAFTAAGTRVVTVLTETQVFVVADVSYSANRNLDTLDEYINNLSGNLPVNSKMGVVCFGKNYEVLCDLGEKFTTVKDSTVDESETDIVSALEFTGGLFDEDCIKRIVLITDGKASDTRDESALTRAVEALGSRNIKVDAIYLDDNIPDTAYEVQVSDADYTRTTYLGHSETATVYIRSTYVCNAVVTLDMDGELYKKQTLELSAGNNAVTFSLYTDKQGTYIYTASVETEGEDESSYNNTYTFTQTVSGDLQVLAISGSSKDNNAVKALYESTENVTVTSVYQGGPTAIPYTVEDLCKYDVFILNNLLVDKLAHPETFVASLDTAVASFGKSLITLGDTSIKGSELEVMDDFGDMLPVDYAMESDSTLWTIVIDSSTSLAYYSRMIMARTAANYILDSLATDGDYFCIVNFYGNAEIAFGPESVAGNRDKIKEKIDGIVNKQSTSIGYGMFEAYNQIMDFTLAEHKEVVLISDGLNYLSSDHDPVKYADLLAKEGIRTTVIDVGRSGNADTSATATAVSLLKNIASAGNGSYFLATSEEALQSVLEGDFTDIMVDAYSETASAVTVEKTRDSVLSNITSLPDVDYFYTSSSKASATTVLTVKYIDESQGLEKTMPLYAYWGYGNGTVASFTGNLTGGSWLSAWQAETGNTGQTLGDLFFNNVLDCAVPDEKVDVPYTVSSSSDGKYHRVEMTPAQVRTGATVSLELTLPDAAKDEEGNPVTETVEMNYSAGVYYYDVEITGTGDYGVAVVYTYAGTEYRADASFTVTYTAEYDSFAVYDASPLYQAVVNSGGTVSEDGKLTLVNDDNEVSKSYFDLTAAFATACVALFVVDIVVRKLKWNDIKNLFVKVKKSK